MAPLTAVVTPPDRAAQPAIVVAPHEDLIRVLQGSPAVDKATVTVLLPVYNEAGLVAKTFDEVAEFARRWPGYEFCFVDDGSTDQTAAIVRERIAATGTNRVSLLCAAKNGGKGAAVRLGVEHAQGSLVCFMDGDLAYSLEHLPLMVAALGMYDVVIGSRKLINEGQKNIRFMRKLLGGGFNLLARVILGVPHRDTQAGLKGFRNAAGRAIFARQRITDFSFDAEMVFVARKLRLRVAEIPAHVSEGHSYKVSKVGLLMDPLRMFADLLRIRANALMGRYKSRGLL